MSTAEQHVVIVTGAARGIGAAVRPAAEGPAVAMLDVNESTCKDTATQIPVQCIGNPDAIVAFSTGDAADFVSGQALHVAGGTLN